jgi:hypothetical protein
LEWETSDVHFTSTFCMTLRRKNILLSCVSFLILATGIFFSYASVQFVTFLYSLLNLSLDVHFRSIGFYYAGTWMVISSVVIFLYLIKLNGFLKQNSFNFISCGLVIIHYLFHLFAIALNYPIFDDQGVILDFLVRAQKADSFKEIVGLIFMPYNESIMVIPKFFVFVWFNIFGEMNFRHLVLFNGLLLILLHLIIFFRYFRKVPTLFFIVTIFIFQFQFYDDAFWAISGLCYYGAFLFATASISLLLKKEKGRNLLSVVFALLSTFTFGNGWMLFPMALIYLISEKKISMLLPWVVAFIASAFVFYLLKHRFITISTAAWNPLDNFLFILIFLGSSMQFFYSPAIPLLGGVFVLSTFVFIFLKKKHLVATFQFLVLGFIILSAIMASPLRSGMEPYGHYGLQVRYGIFSIIAILLCISFIANEFELSSRKIILLAGAAFAYNLMTGLFFYPESVIRKENILVVMEGVRNQDFNIRYTTYDKDKVNALFKEAIEKGIYKP